jgi:hypothetical protein
MRFARRAGGQAGKGLRIPPGALKPRSYLEHDPLWRIMLQA